MRYIPDLVFPYGEARIHGHLKSSIDDFKVFEELGFEATGEGEHLYLLIEKRDTTTDSVNQSLSRHYGVKPYHIGDCGLKDAKAVTRQWFSVHLPGTKEFHNDPDSDDYRVLEKHWSLKKLKKGVHKGNVFQIIIKDITGDIDGASKQLEQIQLTGFANYFGEQRFGKGQRNVDNAMDAFLNKKKLSRSKRSLYLSSIRSFLFNEILTHRLTTHGWLKPIEGDCFMLNGTRSTFNEPLNDDLVKRYFEGDIHAVISLMGEGEQLMTGNAKMLEDEVLIQHKDMISILIDEGLKMDKRAMRQAIKDLTFEFNDDGLELSFYLPKGCYATTFIKHFCTY